MYWYKIRLKFTFIAVVLILLPGLQSCKPDNSHANINGNFFDIKAFFNADIERLRKLNPLINKTVTYNGKTETQKAYIKDWGSELGLFIESDINKPAWKQSYKVTATANFLIYKATDTTLKTQEIIIKKAGGKVKWILISNHTKNMLYETIEKLSYFPDSLYLIQKKQYIKLMGVHKYRIEGKF